VRFNGDFEPLRLTDTEFNEHYPTFSPDGAQIAFVRELNTHGEIVLISAHGGAERRIARVFSGSYSISFAPDGKELAIVDTEDSTDGKQYRVYLINIETGARRRLTAEAEFAGETTPRFAPDGKSLAFVRMFDDKTSDLFVTETTGDAEPRRLTTDGAPIHSLAWSADGREIFFVSLRRDGKSDLWRISSAGGEPQMIVANSRDITNIAASPDGKTIAFTQHFVRTRLWQMEANNDPPRTFVASGYSELDPTFAPDGRRVAFTSDRDGESAIWLADANGKNLRRLTELPQARLARFSPDGSQIAFHALVDSQYDVFVVSTEGGAPRRVTFDAARDWVAAWSADGRSIYYISNRTGGNQIWKTPAFGGADDRQAVQITRGDAPQSFFPAPDGKWIFFTKQNAPGELWRVAAEGGAEERLPQFAANGFDGGWTMTARGIYFFARSAKDTTKIKFYDFADLQIKDVRNVAADKIPNIPNISLDALSDGSRFLYALFDQKTSSIMLVRIEE
jgi:TolB protein